MPLPKSFDDLPVGGGGALPKSFDDLPSGKPTEAPIDPMLPPAGSEFQETAKDIGRGIVRGAARAFEAPPFQPPGTAGQFVQSPAETAEAIEQARGTGPGAFTERHVAPPQTQVGQYAEPIAASALSAPLQPGGVITKALTTVGGALGAKAGGDFAEALELPEPVGAVIGGALGGSVTGGAAATGTAARARGMLPTSQANRLSSKAAYDAIAQAGLVIDPTETSNFLTGLKADLGGTGTSAGRQAAFTKISAPRTFATVKNLEKSGGDLTSIMDTHSRLGTINPGEGSDYAAAMLARDSIREWVANLQPNQVVRGDPQFTSAMWQHARDTWRVHSNLEEIYGALQSAEWRQMSTGAGTNLNTLRQNIRRILDNDKLAARYDPRAREAMADVVEGDLARNTMRKLAKFAPHGPVSSIPVMLTAVTGHADFGTAIAAGGFLAHFLQGRMEQQSLDALLNIIREGSPLTTPRARTMVARSRQPIAGMATARGALTAGAGSELQPPPEEAPLAHPGL